MQGVYWCGLDDDQQDPIRIKKYSKKYNMGNGMNKILPGLYVGNFRDSREEEQLKANKITHILSIHDNSKPYRSDMIYLCIAARDAGNQDLTQYFSQCNDFIHSARIYGGNVLVHCLAGMSRSVTVTVAYIMTVTDLGWRDALNVVRLGRQCASPNYGFQKQLLTFQHEGVAQERSRLLKKYPKYPNIEEDLAEVQRLLIKHNEWVETGGKSEEKTDADTYPLPHNAYSTGAESESSGPAESGSVVTSGVSDQTQIKEDTQQEDAIVTVHKTNNESKSDEALVDEMFGSSSKNVTKTDLEHSNQIENESEAASPDVNPSSSSSDYSANQACSSGQVTLEDLFESSGSKKDSHL